MVEAEFKRKHDELLDREISAIDAYIAVKQERLALLYERMAEVVREGNGP
jgi:hypothetical protein